MRNGSGLLSLTIVLAAFVPAALAQVDTAWTRRYDGPENGADWSFAVGLDSAGNVRVTGKSNGQGSDYDYATIWYSSADTHRFVARYNGPANAVDHASALVVDAAGNTYVTGRSDSANLYGDYLTIKYSSTGVQQWVARYDGPAHDADAACALTVDGAGNVYVTGSSWGLGGAPDYATIKYNSAGVEQWVARYNAPENGYDQAYALAVDLAGNVCVTGWSVGDGTGADCATVMYDSGGAEQWVARYNGPGNGTDWANALALDPAGNVYVTGPSSGSGTGNDYVTIKYSPAGTQRWASRYNGPGNGDDWANALAVGPAGSVYVTGYGLGVGTGDDCATVKYDSTGTELWAIRYNGPVNGGDAARALAVDGSGNVYITGESEGPGAQADYVTVKYSSAGVERWAIRYNGPETGYDVAYDVEVDRAGGVYVTGYSYGSGSTRDYLTIKYVQTQGVAQSRPPLPCAGSPVLNTSLPNPFSGQTRISYVMPGSRPVSLRVYSPAGALVRTLKSGCEPAGVHQVVWDGRNDSGNEVGRGVYYCRLDVGEFTATRQMMKVE